MSNPTRTGKIASLPARIREELNVRLLDGQRGPQLLPWLNELPEVLAVLDERFGEEPITPQNLSEWRTGGYKDWLDRRERVDQLKVLSDYALKLGQAGGGSLSDGSAAIAGGKILELLETASGEDLEKLTQSLVSLRFTDLAAAKLKQRETQLAQAERKIALEEERFRRQTAELFIKWYADQRAKEVVESKSGKEVKMEKLVQLMFGQAPAGAGGAEPTARAASHTLEAGAG